MLMVIANLERITLRRVLLLATLMALLLSGCQRRATPELVVGGPLQATATATPITPSPRGEKETPPTATITATPAVTAPATRTPKPTFTPRSAATATRKAPAPTRTLPPLPVDAVRYTRGGINFGDPNRHISMAYPASLDGEGWTEFYDLELLVSEPTQQAFTQFISQFGGSVFVYADLASGSFVLNVHSGRLKATRQALEAEPLRQMLEGELYATESRETITANLAKLVGREFVFSQGEARSRFVVSQAARMGHAERAPYDASPGEISLFLGGLQQPERSFMMILCSGRQPDEPQTPFPGYFVLGLTQID